MPGFQRPRWDEIRARDADSYRALEKVGFKVDFGDDDSGLWMKYLSRGGGYYIDVGASQLIIDVAIALRSGHAVRELTSDRVVLDSGEQIPADAIVYATGFGNMNDSVRSIFGNEVAERVGPIWGIGSGRYGDPGPWEGEPRNMWKPTAPGLWIQGGNLALSRHYSRYRALQIKARHAGIVTDDHRSGLDGMDHR
jgi:putative flavoprotein involved in K+ transport